MVGKIAAGAAQGLGKAFEFFDGKDYILPTLLGGMDAGYLVAIEKTLTGIQKKMPKGIDLGAEDFGPFGSIMYWDKTYGAIRNNNQALGIAGSLAANMENSIQQSYETSAGVGGEITDLTEAYKNFTEMSSTNRLVAGSELEQIAKLKLAFGEGFEEVFANLAIYGSSIDNTSSMIEESFKKANRMGVNSAKVLKSIRDNIGLIDKFTFRNGIQGLEKMVMLSERYKLNIQSTSAAIEGLNDLDNAIDVTAKLLTLGGDFAQMADPFTLMFEARNNPEQLMQKVIDMAGAYAKFDSEKGFFTIDPYAMDQIKEFANITGMAKEEIVSASKIKAFEGLIGDQVSQDLKTLSNYDEILSKISTNAFFNQDTKSFGINVKDQKGEITFKTVSELNKSDLDQLTAFSQKNGDVYDSLILSNESLSESLERLTRQVKRIIIPEQMYQAADQAISPISEDIRQGNNSGVDFMQEFYEDSSTTIIGNVKKNAHKVGEVVKWFFGASSPMSEPTGQVVPTSSPNTPSIPSSNYSRYQFSNTNNTSNGSLSMNNVEGKIEIGSLDGKIELSLNGVNMDNINTSELIGKMKPMIEEEVRKGIYREVENRTKDNPKSGMLG